MNIYKYDILFQEVPGEISLAFYVCGCPLHCKGCHSPELWTEKNGERLEMENFENLLRRYAGYISCVLFMGGEWHPGQLNQFLKRARQENLKTALYTGLEKLSSSLSENLDFVKLGPWRQELGGLSSPGTNQVFWDLNRQQVLNHLFHHTP